MIDLAHAGLPCRSDPTGLRRSRTVIDRPGNAIKIESQRQHSNNGRRPHDPCPRRFSPPILWNKLQGPSHDSIDPLPAHVSCSLALSVWPRCGPRRRPRVRNRPSSARCSTARTSPAGSRRRTSRCSRSRTARSSAGPRKRLKKNEFLATDKPYGDFVLKAKVKIRNGNSGIQFRSKRKPTTAWSRARRPTWPTTSGGCFTRSGAAASSSATREDKAKALVKTDDWNEFVITAKGRTSRST